MTRRAAGAVAAAAGALLLWLWLGGFAGYDTAHALVWGRQIWEGTKPGVDAGLAPTPHPLLTALGVALAPLGTGAEPVTVALSFLSLTVLAWLTYALGAEWFGRAAGVMAVLILLTRAPVLGYGAQAYLDIPYVALLLGALLVETRRPRAGAPVLALLAVASLLRPEAWLFAAAYVAWMAPGLPRRQLAALGLAAAAAPAAWLVADLLVSGDALHGLSQTRESAAALHRPRGLGGLGHALPGRIEGLLGAGVLAGAGAGLLLAWRWRREGMWLPIAALALAAGATVALATAGLPVVGRYLLAPAAVGAILCAGAALGWRAMAPGDPRRLRWAAVGAAVMAVLALSAPGDAGRIADLRAGIAAHQRAQAGAPDLAHALPGELAARRSGLGSAAVTR